MTATCRGGTTGPSNIDFGLTAAGALPAGDPRIQMQPRDVPVIQTNTQTEIALGVLFPGGLDYRRADSDARNDRYRLWEVPGASHVSNDSNAPVITLQLNNAELEGILPSQLAPVGCTHQLFVSGPATGIPGVVDPNNFPFSYVVNAAFDDLIKWIDFNLPPPRAERIEVTDTTPPTIAVDKFGNALGGVRTPFLDVPTATYFPTDTVAHTTLFSGFCFLYGYNKPFSDATLDSLYKNHFDYAVRVVLHSYVLVARGFWLPTDAQTVVKQALQSDVP
ncbi:MAG: alpha/beta hydrolase domain-containing protein [Candidatus Binataceae bacterium]